MICRALVRRLRYSRVDKALAFGGPHPVGQQADQQGPARPVPVLFRKTDNPRSGKTGPTQDGKGWGEGAYRAGNAILPVLTLRSDSPACPHGLPHLKMIWDYL